MTVTEPTELESKVAAGDDITEADLKAAEQEERKGRLGRLRGRSAANRAEREAERRRVERIAEMESLLADHFGKHEGDLVDLFDEAVAKLSPFVAAAVERNAQLGQMREEIRALQPLPLGMAIHGDGSISAHGARIGPLDVVALVVEVAVRALSSTAASTLEKQAVGTLEKQAQVARDYETFAHYGVERGGLVGPSNRLRNLARTVAGDPPPPHIPKPKQERATAIIVPDA